MAPGLVMSHVRLVVFMVMEFVQHDLKQLSESMKQPFSVVEVRPILFKAYEAVHHPDNHQDRSLQSHGKLQHDLQPPVSMAEVGQQANPHSLRLAQQTGRQGALLLLGTPAAALTTPQNSGPTSQCSLGSALNRQCASRAQCHSVLQGHFAC